MLTLGIESTAHTFGIGICRDDKIIANVKDVYSSEKSGIHPDECSRHHENVKEEVMEKALKEAGISIKDIDAVAYSKGPGLPPCLKVGLKFAMSLKKPLIEVNHCVAHIEIGKHATKCKDPIVLYVSGGNTQIIGYAAGRYRVFGETLDVGIGNAIDKFMRACGQAGTMGGPAMEALAKKGSYVELPYVVKGMDLSFSGILTSAIQKFKKNISIEDLCFSFQETAYAMLTEVTERALAHTSKKEVLLTGGVAASKRLQEMLHIMCEERNAKFYVCPKEYAGDCGAMIAYNGWLAYTNGQLAAKQPDFDQKWRTDDVNVCWM
jgi:N6-L-threonylcarbamoyladenine synthase